MRPIFVGALVAALVAAVVIWRLDVAGASGGIKGDEATYVAMAASVAYDGDLDYTASDYRRIREWYGSGPEGIFLKRDTDAALFFLTPRLRSVVPVALAALGLVCVMPAFAAPFEVAKQPWRATRAGAFKLLPLELTGASDFPVILDQRRGRVPQGTQPTVFVSFIDGAADFGDNGWMAIQPSARAAVADTAGTGTLRYARETLNTGGAFLSDLALQGFGELAAEAVRTVRLDDLPLKRPVRLVKMDVEGAEPKVIAGARELIAADRPIVISEVHPEQLARVSASTPAALFDQLGACGLRPHGSVDGRLGPRVDAAAIAGVTLAFVLPS